MARRPVNLIRSLLCQPLTIGPSFIPSMWRALECQLLLLLIERRNCFIAWPPQLESIREAVQIRDVFDTGGSILTFATAICGAPAGIRCKPHFARVFAFIKAQHASAYLPHRKSSKTGYKIRWPYSFVADWLANKFYDALDKARPIWVIPHFLRTHQLSRSRCAKVYNTLWRNWYSRIGFPSHKR